MPSLPVYLAVKHLHVSMVYASGALFVVRGLLMLWGSAHGMRKPVRVASYLMDTVLLAAAVSLLVMLQLNPFTTPWLAVKLTLLVGYIVLGSLALKRGRTYARRAVALNAALLCFALIYSIARQHHPLGFWMMLMA